VPLTDALEVEQEGVLRLVQVFERHPDLGHEPAPAVERSARSAAAMRST
jgi:hypothetical protein